MVSYPRQPECRKRIEISGHELSNRSLNALDSICSKKHHRHWPILCNILLQNAKMITMVPS
jgi:hypothetical protein